MSLTKANFRIVDASIVNVVDFGADPTGILDSTVEIQNAVNAAGTGQTIYFPKGIFKVSSTINIPGNSSIWSNDAIIEMDGDNVGATLYIGDTEEPITNLPSLAVNLNSRQTNIEFASDHGLQNGDWIAICNPSNFSYSSFRPGYKAGEFAQVEEVVSATEIKIYSSIMSDDGYDVADVNLYKVDFKTFGFNGPLTVNSGTGISQAVVFNFIKSSDISNLRVIAENGNVGLALSRCVEISGQGIYAFQNENVSQDYGAVLVGCQSITLDGFFKAYRHAFSTVDAAQDQEISIVNRNLKISGHFASLNLLHGLDTHGNTEYCQFSGFVDGGALVRGNHLKYNIQVTADYDGRAIRFAELSGFDHDFSGSHLIGSVQNSAWGLISLGYDDNVDDDVNAKSGCLNFSNITIDAPFTSLVMSINKKAATSAIVSVDSNNMKLINTAANPLITITSEIGLPQFLYWDLNGVEGIGSTVTATHQNCAKVKAVITGITTVTTGSANSTSAENQNFGISFGASSTPSLQVSLASAQRVSGKMPVCGYFDLSSSNVDIFVATSDNSAFGSVIDVDVAWTAISS